MGNKKKQQNKTRAAQLRAFYASLNLSEDMIERAINADLKEVPQESSPPPDEPADKKSD
jgi:hypothetical protein